MNLEKGKRNIIELLNAAANNYSNKNYTSHKTDEGWVSYTYTQVRDNANSLSAALLDIGIKKGDNAAIISEGSPMWVMSEYSLLNIGAVAVPLSVKLMPEEIPFRLDHSDSVAVFISKNNLPKLLQIIGQVQNKSLKLIYLNDDVAHFYNALNEAGVDKSNGFVFWELLEKGDKLFKENPNNVLDIKNKIDENDVVTISYTSGTTGQPKGIMLTHLNYYSNTKDGIESFKLKKGFRTLVILPVDHSFAHTVALYGALFSALDLYFLDTRGGVTNAIKNIPINLKEVNPDFLLTVPALSGNFMNKMKEGVKEKGKVIDALFETGLNAAKFRNGDGYNKPGMVGQVSRYFSFIPAKSLIFNKLKNVFGGKINYMVGGGALLDIKQQQFYRAIGTPVYQGYGLTEAAPIISSNTPHIFKMGTSGKIMPSISCRIMKDDQVEAKSGEIGEIVIKGDNVMKGYYKNETDTNKTIKDGWLWTGDLGFMDEDGFLVVTGRNKALLISEDGEKYSPEGIEEAMISNSELVGQAMVYNDQKKYTTAVVTIDPLKVAKLKGKASKEVLEMVKNDIEAFKSDPVYAGQFPKKWTPSYFYIAPEPFSEENKMVNSTLKMVRYKILEGHKNEIDKLYEGSASQVSDELNLKSLDLLLN